MKIRLATKNSVWKIVQNPLKNNYYTDIMDFENDEARGEFLNKYQFNGENELAWNDLDAYVDTIVKWSDELHFSFIIDETQVPFTRTEALRKDFAIIYDENDKIYRFCTIQANFPRAQWQSTQLSYNGEMDVFFTYGIRNVWKKDANITIERAVIDKQWDVVGGVNKPSINTSHYAYNSENFDVSGSYTPKKISENWNVDNNNKGAVLLFKPQRRFFQTNCYRFGDDDNPGNNDRINVSGYFEDSIIIYGGDAKSDTTEPEYLLLKTSVSNYNDDILYNGTLNNDRPSNIVNFTTYKYNDAQKVGENKIYKKNEYYISLFIYYNEFNNLIHNHNVSTLLNSPDLIQVIHGMDDSLLNYSTIESYHIQGNNGNCDARVKFNTVPGTTGKFTIERHTGTGSTYNFKIVEGNKYSQNINIQFNTPSTSITQSDNYSPLQYSKLYIYPFYYISLINAAKQNWILSLDYANIPTLTVKRELIYILQGLYGKMSTNVGLYRSGDLRNGLQQEEIINIESYRNTDDWAKYVSENSLSLNLNAKIMDRDRKLAIFNGVVNIVSGAANTVSGAMLGKFGAAGTDFKDPSTKEVIGHGITSQDQLNITKGMSEGAGGLNQIARGITSLFQVNDNINRQTASLRDRSNNANSIASSGVEYERIAAFDVSPFNVRTEEYVINTNVRTAIGNYFHRYGYQTNLLANPLSVLNNGRIFDYLQAEFTSVYAGLSEDLSPQEAKIVAESISYGVRVWHYNDLFTTVGDYSKRNIKG